MGDFITYIRDLLERGIAFATLQAPNLVEQVSTRHWVAFGYELFAAAVFAALYLGGLLAANRAIGHFQTADDLNAGDVGLCRLSALVLLSIVVLPFCMVSLGGAAEELAAALTPELSAIERVTR